MGFALCCRVCCFCVVCGCFCVVVCCVLSCVVFVVVWCVVSWLCCVLSWLFLLSLSVCVVCFTGSSYVGGGHAWARTGSLDAPTSLPEHGRATSLASEALLSTSKCRCWWSAARSWPSVLSGRRRSIYLRLHRRARVCASGGLTCSNFDCARPCVWQRVNELCRLIDFVHVLQRR